MDAFVQVALIEKAKRVFSSDPGVMLSFPLLSPVSFSPADVAGLSAPASVADYAVAAEFARVVNFLPRDIVASASDRMLWDVYADVLTRARVASGSANAGRASDSGASLYTLAPDGTRVESDAYKLYRQYRDAWIVAREDYNAHKSTGELSDDPAVRNQWVAVDEPALRGAVDSAALAWATQGHRAAIEAALQAERSAAMSDPSLCWARWQQGFNPDLDLVTDGSGTRYGPTGLSPRNIADGDGWLRFDLSASEMAALVAGAPAPLKAVLDDQPSTVDHVTFEYRSVALVRPWFNPEVLTSRVWRSDDPDLSLSDGGDPSTGACPAYVTACVFVRHVVITSHSDGAAQPFRNLRFTIDPTRLQLRRDLRVDPAVLARAAETAPSASFRPVIGSPPVRPGPAGPSLSPAQVNAFRAIQASSFTTAPRAVAQPARPGIVRPMPVRTMQGQQAVMASDNIRLPPGVFGTPQPPPPPPPPPVIDDDLSILAFICKRLPKAPDPSPDLRWA